MPRLLFVSFIDFGDMKSGSSVRPQRMFNAFLNLGYEVSLLSGLQNRRRERWANVLAKIKEIKKNPPDFCYVEPPSGPFFNLCDHLLLLYLRLKKIPVGLFYRDAYWKFADWWPYSGPKSFFLKMMQRFDLFIFRLTVDVMFFPSKSMADLFNFKNKAVLPPAGLDQVIPEHPTFGRALYIGGVSEHYGTDMMLRAFSIINERMKQDVKLTVCCRKEEMGGFFDDYLKKPWLTVVHLSGDAQLAPLYAQSDVALFPNRRDFYMDFCMPVKLFEYLSRALPVVSTDCREAAGFVLQNGIGVVAQDSPEAFATAVASLVGDRRQLRLCRVNAENALRRRNLWEHRAKFAAEKILSHKNTKNGQGG